MQIETTAPKTNGYQLQSGDKFTIEGCGLSARGHKVVAGRSVKTGRKMKVKTLTTYKVVEPNIPIKGRASARPS